MATVAGIVFGIGITLLIIGLSIRFTNTRNVGGHQPSTLSRGKPNNPQRTPKEVL